MKKNKAIRYALVLAGLLSLTGCKEEEKQASVPSKKEVKIEQIQKENRVFSEQEKQLEKKWDEIFKLQEDLDKKWDKVNELGVPHETLLKLANKKNLIENCAVECKCPNPHDMDPRHHYPIICSLEKNIKKVLPNYDTLPLEAKAVILQTELLAENGLKDFPKMTEAFRKNDFTTAAKQSAISGYPKSNILRKKILLNIAQSIYQQKKMLGKTR